jgi:hypothetical protein
MIRVNVDGQIERSKCLVRVEFSLYIYIYITTLGKPEIL